jgi:hypothetical protein
MGQVIGYLFRQSIVAAIIATGFTLVLRDTNWSLNWIIMVTVYVTFDTFRKNCRGKINYKAPVEMDVRLAEAVLRCHVSYALKLQVLPQPYLHGQNQAG